MQLQVVTVVTNSLLAQLNITVHVCGCYDVAADRISSELPSVRSYVAKLFFFFFFDFDKNKKSINVVVINK
jgi:hypothetical protein